MLTAATPASARFTRERATRLARKGGSLCYRGAGARPIRLEEHCTECGAPQCYQHCKLFEAALGAGCRRFECGIGLAPSESWTGASAELTFRTWGMLKAKISDVDRADPWRLGFLLQIETIARSGELYQAVLDFTASPWAPDLPQVRIPLQIESGSLEIYVPASDLTHLAGVSAAQVSLSFPDRAPAIIYLHDSHFVEQVTDVSGQRLPCRKLLCVDLDGTVWQGEADEAGEAPQLKEGALDGLLRARSRRLTIVAITRASAAKAHGTIERLGLRDVIDAVESDVVSKVAAFEQVRTRLGLLQSESIFVDDDPFERDQMLHRRPDVMVRNEAILRSLWIDPSVTAAAGTSRDISSRYFGGELGSPRSGAVPALGSLLEYRSPLPSELIRCYELLQRTNRMHAVEWRPSLAELARSIEQQQVEVRIGICSDRTGSYGVSCLAIVDLRATLPLLRSLTYSCRLLGRAYPWAFARMLADEFDAPIAVAASPCENASPIARQIVEAIVAGELPNLDMRDPVEVRRA